MLEVHDLAFGFPGRTVGRNVSFTLAAGDLGDRLVGKARDAERFKRAASYVLVLF